MYDMLASVYDKFQEVDYGKFVDYYEKIFQKYNIEPTLILDLGCGTGNITIPMAERGYDMIGVDLSVEMLEIAAGKARAANKEILFLNQDMTEFELYGTVDAMVCALDGVNYLTEDGQLSSMLSKLHYYLNPGGILVFDINTEYKFRNVLDGSTFVYDDEDAYCVWNSDFDESEKICYFDLNIFTQNPDGTYTRQDEYQQERVYSVGEIKEVINGCGLELLGVYDDLTFDAQKAESERLFFVVKRN